MFGGGGGTFSFDTRPGPSRPKRSGRGKDTTVVYEVSLEDLFNGKTVGVMLEKLKICGSCTGTGGKKGAKPHQCAKCSGAGEITVNRMLAGRMLAQSRAVCPVCEGEGTKIRDKDTCRKCSGQKVVSKKEKARWQVEKGMRDGDRIVLKEHGDEWPGTTAGDVVFVLSLQAHDTFQLAASRSTYEPHSSDLLTTITLTLSEALTGFSRVALTHLDGRPISLSIPPGKPVNSGDALRVAGEGMWEPDQAGSGRGKRGDLWVRCQVEKLSEEWASRIDLDALARLLPPKRASSLSQPDDVRPASYTRDDEPPLPAQQRTRPNVNEQYDEGAHQEDFFDERAYYDEDPDSMPPQCQQQ